MLSFASDLLFRKPTPPAKPEPQTEDFKGISNVTGRVRGHANGLINFGDAAPTGTSKSGQKKEQRYSLKEQAEAVQVLAEAVAKLDGDSNRSAGGNLPPGTKKVRGLSNITGNVKGTGNGGINFGELAYNDTPVEDDPVKKRTPQKKK
ncbi:hypothetical protein L6164_013150 [Bauhinia variegata]|uniref:Uncharacterized protein n=1 Tax=Bauhinia variegata TaxID=167791 RepID=A0ACB9PCE1_BAUVA|nr:hypothetical protein L6164_013150 [Bauhinia variegata]